ncbi:ATP-binding cassette domain-containing protein [Actinoplanes sp. NPDC049265]|uniref:ATP-binding cassette domain-containing protein n=1 Tax=Actinoplanes sp. NPDC049265 TaxID=3363902 RepID=UPI003716D035
MSVLIAEGVGVRHRRRWIVRGLDAVVEPGELVALTGPPGSGRTTALLALAGRFKLSAGKIHTPAGTPPSARDSDTPAPDAPPAADADPVDGTPIDVVPDEAAPGDAGRDEAGTVGPMRRGVALAYVAGVNDPEPTATVAEHVRERLALLGHRRRRFGRRRELPSVPLLGLDPDLRGRDLTPYQRQLLGLVLARMENPAVIALDDWDAGLDEAERWRLRQIFTDLTTEGIAVIITARTVACDLTTHVINLEKLEVAA